MKNLLLLGAFLALGSCASMSEAECERADWGYLGYRDGAQGKLMTKLNNRADACEAYGLEANVTAYREGRQRGLQVFCTPQNAYRYGTKGEAYRGQCVDHREDDFLYEYERGYELYTFTSVVDEAEGDISRLRNEIRDCRSDIRDLDDWLENEAANAPEEEVARKKKKRRKLRDRLDNYRDDLDFARDRLLDAERALNAYLIGRG